MIGTPGGGAASSHELEARRVHDARRRHGRSGGKFYLATKNDTDPERLLD